MFRGEGKQRVEPGDHHELRPYRVWELFSRVLFYRPFRGWDGTRHVYAVNVNYFDGEMKADLYLDGRHKARAGLPAVFPVEHGRIEVATSVYGIKRMHFVNQSGTGSEEVLSPDPLSPEGLRARLDSRMPRLSAMIGKIAIAILLVTLPLGALQLAEVVTTWDVVRDYVGPFSSPITLPGWANVAVTVAGVLAGIERALTLRSHRLVDAELGWLDI